MSTRLSNNFNQQIADFDDGQMLAQQFQVSLEEYTRDSNRLARLVGGDESVMNELQVSFEAEDEDNPSKIDRAITFLKELVQKIVAKLKMIGRQFMEWLFNKYDQLKAKYRRLREALEDYTNPEVELTPESEMDFIGIGALSTSASFTSLRALESAMSLPAAASLGERLIGRDFPEIRWLGYWMTEGRDVSAFENIDWKSFRDIPTAAATLETFKEHFAAMGRRYGGKYRTKQLKRDLAALEKEQGEMEEKSRYLKKTLNLYEERLMRRPHDKFNSSREATDYCHEQKLGLDVIAYYSSAIRGGMQVRANALEALANMCNKALRHN